MAHQIVTALRHWKGLVRPRPVLSRGAGHNLDIIVIHAITDEREASECGWVGAGQMRRCDLAKSVEHTSDAFRSPPASAGIDAGGSRAASRRAKQSISHWSMT